MNGRRLRALPQERRGYGCTVVASCPDPCFYEEDGGEWVWEVDDEVEGIRGVVFCPFCGERLRGDE